MLCILYVVVSLCSIYEAIRGSGKALKAFLKAVSLSRRTAVPRFPARRRQHSRVFEVPRRATSADDPWSHSSASRRCCRWSSAASPPWRSRRCRTSWSRSRAGRPRLESPIALDLGPGKVNLSFKIFFLVAKHIEHAESGWIPMPIT